MFWLFEKYKCAFQQLHNTKSNLVLTPRRLLILPILLLLLINYYKSYACTCKVSKEKVSIEDSVRIINAAKFAFLGKVIKIDSVEFGKINFQKMRFKNYKYTFSIIQPIKGANKKHRKVVLYSGLGNGDCGEKFTKGCTYFVVAKNDSVIHNKKAKNIICTDACMNNRQIFCK